MKFHPSHAALCLLLFAVLPACKRIDEHMEIGETRVVSNLAAKPSVDVPSSTRFYDDQKNKAQGQGMAGASLRDLLAWTVPEGWSESDKPDPTGMRTVDLRFGPNKEGECYVSLMAGPAGGLSANINRWRTQMGQPPYTPEELEKLEKKKFFGREADFVAFDGNYKGVGAAEAKNGYRLMGVIHSAPQATMFVKLIGPKALVEQNAAAFDQFCQSIRSNVDKEDKAEK